LQAVIFAGGLGTRLGSITKNIPKPMVRVHGKPFLEYELSLLSSAGIKNFVLCVGYLGKVIQDFFGDGSRFDVNLEYSFDGEKPRGVAGALKRAESLLQDTFFVTYGDAYLRADYSEIFADFAVRDKLGMMLVNENHNAFGRSDLAVTNGYISKYDKRNQTPDMVWINYGVSILRKKALQFIPIDREVDEEEFYGDLIKRGELLAKVVSTRFYEIGTPAALQEFKEFMSKRER
jgi:NDP-sugar pyrophosphorylase family protein